MDLQEQLAQLRRRIARIDRKYADGPKPEAVPAPRPSDAPERYNMDHWLGGKEVETAAGKHFETERLWERHRRHGSIAITDLFELPADLLDAISDGQVRGIEPGKWCYLDTETTVGGFIPDSSELGKPLDTVVGIDKVVKVDLFIPGCPPRVDAFFYALSELLAGRTPVILPPEHFVYD